MRRLAALLLVSPCLFAAPAGAAVPAGFEDTLVAPANGATAIAFTPDGRLLIAQRQGELRIFKNLTLLAAPALNIVSKTCSESERGLLGVAVDSDFATNRRVYLYYTYKKSTCEYRNANTPVNRVSRFTLGDDDVIAPSSEVVLVDNIPSYAGNHNAGALEFGRDNYLYVGVGDGGCDYGGSGCGPANDAAREPHTLLGKVLRITPSGGIPNDNPFRGANSARCAGTGRTDPGKVCQEIYATGLRNPFRLGFDPNGTGNRFLINDVGQETWEEIDLGQAGADYGWNLREGNCATGSPTNCGLPPAGLTNPVYAYGHGGGCTSITGGAFVPNRIWPSASDGSYLFADYGCSQIRRLPNPGSGALSNDFASGNGAPLDLTFGPYSGGQALYYATLKGTGDEIAGWPTPATVPHRADGDRTDRRARSADCDLRRPRQQRSGRRRAQLRLGLRRRHSALQCGSRRPHVHHGRHLHRAAARDRQPWEQRDRNPAHRRRQRPAGAPDRVAGDHRPLPRGRDHHSPRRRDRSAGRHRARQPAELDLRLRHNSHTHPFLSRTGNNITFSAPPPENLVAAATSYLEVELTATDSLGLSRSIAQDLRPRTAVLTFATTPGARTLVVDRNSVTAPVSFTSWEGYAFGVDAPLQGDGSGTSWIGESWSDGGARAHTITTPATPTTYVATFARCGGGALGASVVVLGLFGVPYLRRRRRGRTAGDYS